MPSERSFSSEKTTHEARDIRTASHPLGSRGGLDWTSPFGAARALTTANRLRWPRIRLSLSQT
jgi:hypothetical protein